VSVERRDERVGEVNAHISRDRLATHEPIDVFKIGAQRACVLFDRRPYKCCALGVAVVDTTNLRQHELEVMLNLSRYVVPVDPSTGRCVGRHAGVSRSDEGSRQPFRPVRRPTETRFDGPQLRVVAARDHPP